MKQYKLGKLIFDYNEEREMYHAVLDGESLWFIRPQLEFMGATPIDEKEEATTAVPCEYCGIPKDPRQVCECQWRLKQDKPKKIEEIKIPIHLTKVNKTVEGNVHNFEVTLHDEMKDWIRQVTDALNGREE